MVDDGLDERRADNVGVGGQVVGLQHAAGGEAHMPDAAAVNGALRTVLPGLVRERVGVVPLLGLADEGRRGQMGNAPAPDLLPLQLAVVVQR